MNGCTCSAAKLKSWRKLPMAFSGHVVVMACHTFAGKIQQLQAASGSLLFLGAFMYAFWRVGIYWPGVPPPEHGFFRLKQVAVGLARKAVLNPLDQ